ncbi:fimbrial biogenesis chaperone [Pseudomonas segetis]
MRSALRKMTSCLLAGLLVAPLMVQAGVQIAGTRFIYPAGEREINVRLTNTANKPALVQAWLDAGDPSVQPGAEQLPFVVLPPLVRVEANKGQTLRVVHVGGQLPKDQESVFWLNVLEVPPRAKGTDDRNVMQLAFRTRLKLFYRPEGLQGKLQDAVEKLSWTLVHASTGYALQARNDSAFHVSFAHIELKAGGKKYSLDSGGMVAPRATQDFPLKGLNGPVSSGQVQVNWLDDFGASREQSYELKR